MIAKISSAEGLIYKEIPINGDGSISISVLRKYFPGCIGIRYRCKSSGSLKGTKVFNDQLILPLGESWNENIFFCVYEERSTQPNSLKEHSLIENFQLDTFDMIVLGLPDDITDESFIQYFSRFGELKLCKLKKNLKIQKSKGYGFLRYSNFIDQHDCIKTIHIIGGSEVSLRLPSAMMDDNLTCKKKLFVTNITPSVTFENILEYFSVFGKITEIFMPPVPSPYAFLTFDSEECVIRVFRFGESHRVFGGYVIVERVYTKKEMNEMHNNSEDVNEYRSNEIFNSERVENTNNNNSIHQNEPQNVNYNFHSDKNKICENQFNFQHYDRQQQQCDEHQQYELPQHFRQQLNELQQKQTLFSTQEDQFREKIDRDSQFINQIQYMSPNNYFSYDQDRMDISPIPSTFSSTLNVSLQEKNQFCLRCSELVQNHNSNLSNHSEDISKRCQESDISMALIMQILSDMVACIIQEMSVPKTKDVLIDILTEKLLTSISKMQNTTHQRIGCTSTEKMIRAIQILQNPAIIDSIFRLSDKMDMRPG